MTANGDQDPRGATLSSATIDIAIRLGFIVLIGYWSFTVVAPFVTIGLWSAVLAVALYPLFKLVAVRLGPRAAALCITLLCLAIVVGPVTWLALGMISGISSLVTSLNNGQLAIPPPPESIRNWPIVGERLHQFWSLATTNVDAALSEVLPMLKPLASKLVAIAQNAFYSLLQLLMSIVIAGFLFTRGPQLVDALGGFLTRALTYRGQELIELAGATIRNVSRGVIGISFLQALLGGFGFLVAGIPAPGGFALLALLLGIVQIGPTILFIPIIIWSWTAMEATHALAFTVYMTLVSFVDNVLKPVLMARGLTTPMPVILVGVIGGAIAYGIAGLFLGPVVLSVAWAVLVAWVQGGGDSVMSRKR
jgi:predicted PurR-regulated permease PerM